MWKNFQHIEKIIPSREKHRWEICIKCGKKIKADTRISTNDLKNYDAHYTEQMAQPQPVVSHENQESILDPQVQRNTLVKFTIGSDLPLNIGVMTRAVPDRDRDFLPKKIIRFSFSVIYFYSNFLKIFQTFLTTCSNTT